jgi:hypothetical protein
MKSSIINLFLQKKFSLDSFKEAFNSEVEEYERLLKVTGSTIPLYLEEDEELYISKVGFIHLLEQFNVENLSTAYLAYICDCLSLAEDLRCENEELKEIIFELADPEINGGYKSDGEIKAIILKIQSQ